MIRWLVFSKDRPLQLDALLSSIERYIWWPCQVTVIARGGIPLYDRVARDHPWAQIEHEQSFEEDVRNWLSWCEGPVGFLTDDSLFYQPVPHPFVLPFAYRVGRNTVRCETLGIDQEPPESLSYDWAGRHGDFGYPLSVDGTVYEKSTILPLLDFAFRNPTELEAGIAARADRFERPVMHMADHSSLVVFAHTRVSDSSGCPYSGLYSTDELIGRYLAGQRIRPDEMGLDRVDSASTMQIPYVIY